MGALWTGTETMAAGPTAGAMLAADPARSALQHAAAALDRAEQHAHPLEMSLALAQLGRCYRALQALAPAEAALEHALRWAGVIGAVDQSVDVLCQLAETGCAIAEQHAGDGSRRGHAALERTRDRAFEAAALAGRVADPHWEIKVLLRVSDVLDRCGDHEEAIGLQVRALSLMYCGELAGSAGDQVPTRRPAAR
jgi:tetratricopeptide (TPR) repeat protein